MDLGHLLKLEMIALFKLTVKLLYGMTMLYHNTDGLVQENFANALEWPLSWSNPLASKYP